MANNENIFNAKGMAAEELIAGLCGDAFFRDFCFLNPYVGTGKGRKELCDVLVVLGDTAIIFQIKNVKLGKDGMYKEKDIQKAIDQSHGAKRKLLSLGKVQFVNVDGKEKEIDTGDIKRVYLVAPIEGEEAELAGIFDASEKGNVHIFYEKFTRFATKHLNTVKDFVRYLDRKEQFLADGNELILTGGEEELLVHYINHNKSFEQLGGPEATTVVLHTEGAAEELEADEGYKAKLEADFWSEAWDELIARKRLALPYDGELDDMAGRDKFLAAMMNHDRFERRILGKTFMDAAGMAAEAPPEKGNVYRRYMQSNGITYVFAFMGKRGDNPMPRRAMLSYAALAARTRFPNRMVIAVATAKDLMTNPDGDDGFDWVLLDMTDEELKVNLTEDALGRFKSGGFLTNPEIKQVRSWEFPEDVPKHEQ